MIESLDSVPALLGGKPVRPDGPPAWPVQDDEIRRTLDEAYRNGAWGKYRGVYAERLEQCLAEYHDIEFVQTCASGTFAVELALRALKIGPGDEVVLAAYDYPGNFLSVHAVGAVPVLVDLDPGNWNLDTNKLKSAIGSHSRAIIVSHLHGGMVPMGEVMEIAQQTGLKVIEDAAQVPGAVYQGREAGTWGDAGILSFGGSKLLSAGRGGALLTRHADVYQRARVWMNRGNQLCPLSELQAAVLLPQLEKLDSRNLVRTRSVAYLLQRIQHLPGILAFANRSADTVPSYYKLGFQFDSASFGLSRDRFLAAMRAEGIAFDEGFPALHVGRSGKRFRRGTELSEAEKAHYGAVVLHHPVLLGETSEIEEIVSALEKIYANVEKLGRVS